MKKFAPDLDPVDGGPAGQEGMAYRYGYNAKDFNENLSPLYGQVRKAVGKPWNKFYSELCKVFDKRSVINQHILQHLDNFVEKDVYERDGRLYVMSHYRFSGGGLLLKDSHCEFYVDPRDGIIKKNKYRETYRQALRARRAEQAKEEAKRYRVLSANEALGKIGELWFVLDIMEIPPKTPITSGEVWDVYKGAFVSRSKFGPTTFHFRKRSASKKLLKQHGLK